jgi:molybdopterin-guanine dinucleotide biosynthesis protein A
MSDVVVGLLVGGASRRMGGRPKGLLPAIENDGTTIVERTLRLSRAIASEVVLVGAHEAYAHLGCSTLPDAAIGAGPLGGVAALLRHASERGMDAVGVACDMPYVTESLLLRLVRAEHGPSPIVAPREDGRWSTLFARYDAACVLPFASAQLATPDKSLQALFRKAGVWELPLSDEERCALSDWDAPADVERAEKLGSGHRFP